MKGVMQANFASPIVSQILGDIIESQQNPMEIMDIIRSQKIIIGVLKFTPGKSCSSLIV